MELLIVIIAVVLVAVIAFAFRLKPNTSGQWNKHHQHKVHQ